MVHPDDRAKTEAVGEAAMRQGGTIDYQYRIIRPGGAVRWLASKGEVFVNADGKPAWAAGAIFDITELRQAQQELAAREAKYRALSQMNAIGEWIAAPDGSVCRVSFGRSSPGRRKTTLAASDGSKPCTPKTVMPSWQVGARH